MDININDYVHSNEYGLGIITNKENIENNEMYNIKFSEKIVTLLKSDINSYGFKVLQNKLVEYILSEEWNDEFSFAAVSRGMNYFVNKKIVSFQIDNNLFKGLVAGTRNYNVFISYNGKKVTMDCTCPFGYNCKHEVAFLLFLKDYLKHSIDDIKNTNIDNYEDEVEDTELLKFIKSRYNSPINVELIESFFEYSKLINRVNLSDYITILKKLYARRNNRISKAFMILSLYNSENANIAVKSLSYEVGVFYTTLIYDIGHNKNRHYAYNQYKDEDVEALKIIKNSVNKNVVIDILDFLYEINARSSYSVALMSYIIDKIEPNVENTNKLVDIMRYLPYDFKKSFENYISKCDFHSIRLYVKKNMNNLTTFEKIEKINDESIFVELAKIYNSNEIKSYIFKNIEKLCSINKKKTILMLKEMDINYYQRDIDFLKNNDLIKPYFNFITMGYNRQVDFPRDFNDEGFGEPIYMDIFETNYESKYEEDNYTKEFKIYTDFFGREVFGLVIVNENGKIYLRHNYLVNGKYELVNIYNYLCDKYRDEINRDDEKYAIAHAKYLDRENDKRIASEIQSFGIVNKNFEIPSLIEEAKVNIEYHFDKDLEGINLSLKVGNQKMYVVQNLYKFKTLFSEGLYETYGKNYGFYHSLNNLSTPHNKVLKYLLNSCNISEYEKKSFIISQISLDDIFEMLEKKNIYYKEINYLVSLDSVDYKVSIDEEYKIGVKYFDKDNNEIIGYKNIEILVGLNYTYVLIRKDVNEVLALSNSNNSNQLLNFALRNTGFKVKNNIDSFINEIYLRYPNKFIVDESISEAFNKSIVTIELYFDYANGCITLERKFKCDEEYINYLDLKDIDHARLDKIEEFLRSIGFEYNENKDENNTYDEIIKNDELVYGFFTLDFSRLREYASVYMSDSITKKRIVKFTKQNYRIQYENDLMTIFMQDSNFTPEELANIFAKIKRKKKYVLLKNDTIVRIDNDDAKQFEKIVKDFDLDSTDLTRPKVIPVYQALKIKAYEDNISCDDLAMKIIDEIANFKNYELGDFALRNTLRPYQLDGVKWLTILSKYNMGGILADDMGLGKTIQMIATLMVNSKDKPSLVVCPKTLIYNWKREFQTFDKDSEVIPIYGSIAERKDIISKINPYKRVIYITSYDSLRNDIELYDVEFHYTILDEAQAIKNVSALKSISVKMLKSEVKFALTGTPIENNIIDLWSIFDFVLPAYLAELSVFKDNYEHDEDYLNMIVKKVSPFILRRCKKDVLKDLPEKYEQIVTVDMKGEQLKLYQAYIAKAQEMMGENSTFEVLQFLTRLRQICVSPETFIDEYNGESEKMEYLKDNLSDYINDGHKILIFSQFVQALNIVEDILKEKGIKYFMLTGDTKAMDRIDMCSLFNSKDSQEKVFLISLKAGGNGINLVGADMVIHLDPWWNVSAENQATDRAHRIGQTRNLKVIKLICSDSIEQRVIELQNMKKDLIDKVISNDESSITKITQEDIKFILS